MGEPNLLDKVIGKTEKVGFHITDYFAALTVFDTLYVGHRKSYWESGKARSWGAS